MLAYTYVEKGKFELKEKEKPVLKDGQDAIVRVTMGSICSSDLQYQTRFGDREVLGITMSGYANVGNVEEIGKVQQ